MSRSRAHRFLIGALLLAGLLLPAFGWGGEAEPPSVAHSDPECPVCRLWDEYRDALLEAHHEIGALENGVVHFFYSTNFRIVEELQRFAYRRRGLETSGAARRHPLLAPGTRLEISTSAHGAFAILSTSDRSAARALREQASIAARNKTLMEF